MGSVPWVVLGVVITIAAIALARILVRQRRTGNIQRAKQEFRQRREWLEARFFSLAASSGKPRGLAWTNCDFANAVSFASEPETGLLRAFVGVTVSFEAIEGVAWRMSKPSAICAATAVFEYDGNAWGTQGRVIFNLEPQEAILHFHHRPLIAD